METGIEVMGHDINILCYEIQKRELQSNNINKPPTYAGMHIRREKDFIATTHQKSQTTYPTNDTIINAFKELEEVVAIDE